jgi:hypothetical protein
MDREGGGVLGVVDTIIRQHGVHPSADVRALLAAAAEQRMAEHGESFPVAVSRAMATLVTSARRRA